MRKNRLGCVLAIFGGYLEVDVNLSRYSCAKYSIAAAIEDIPCLVFICSRVLWVSSVRRTVVWVLVICRLY